MRAFVGWLLFATAALAATPIQRELFTLELPRSWKETPGRFSELTFGGGEATAPRPPTSRFIAGTKDCGCVVSAFAAPHGFTPEQSAAIARQHVPTSATLLRVTALTELAGRRGAGFRGVVQQPYDIATVVQVFTFVEHGVACTVQGQASAREAATAEKILGRHLADLQAIVASLRLKAPAAAAQP